MTRLDQRPLDENTQHFLEQAHESPFDFHSLSVKAVGDEKLKSAIMNAVRSRAFTASSARRSGVMVVFIA